MFKFLQKIIISLCMVFICVSFISCKSTSSNNTSNLTSLSETKNYESIQKAYKRKRWEDVTNDVNEFRARYPYSKYTAELELMQANSFFNSKNYSTAIVTYEDFIRRNPASSQVVFASFRIAESYDRDSMQAIDRDQTNTRQAVNKYNEFIDKYPNEKEFVEKANNRLAVLNRRLGEHTLFVATFYWNKNLYAAALMRYLEILSQYPQFEDLTKTAKTNGSYCYKKLASILEADPKSDSAIFFKNETPQGLREKAAKI